MCQVVAIASFLRCKLVCPTPITKIFFFRKDEDLLQLILEGEAEGRKTQLEEAEEEEDNEEEESSAEEEDVDEAVGNDKQSKIGGFY